MPTLTKKQKLVLDFIKSFVTEHGYAPSYAEIAEGLGLSSQSTVHAHVENLQVKGFLTKRWNANRSIDLELGERAPSEVREVPLLGRIAAGEPLEAVEDLETIALPEYLLGRGDAYVLQVRGDSMIDDHIMHGDYVIVEKRDAARDGEMVVALINRSEATLKRFRREGRKVRLEPANPRYHAQVYDEKDVNIRGVVVGILRKYGR
ncbi:MAG: transcriptional repressor LexA [Thermodesulfobacteriota bacterium]